uniref:Uncharacterized protein n=1 Tax=Siphoviridae sp. ctiPM17 TaxID=2825623 RepID=A0A8S5NTZ0_9CAUD|nr:MAG TPA: hypothetical protein [Siphoviridae sp. ctiPM17]DAI24286.1 MAG TPA: hypothetical protein [Caudoviricetes sp.]DAT36022.1 MAG TPA: hypothetical protein [Caudoviricetes sp.]
MFQSQQEIKGQNLNITKGGINRPRCYHIVRG